MKAAHWTTLSHTLAIVLSTLLLSTVFIMKLGFLLGIPVNGFSFLLAILSSSALFFAFGIINRQSWKGVSLGLGVTLLLSITLSLATYDLSWDGQSYHQETIIQLADGWIPDQQKIVLPVPDTGMSLWLNHYPHSAEVFAASVFHLTRNIELAKMANILWVIIAFLFAIPVFIDIFQGHYYLSIASALVVALNPVSNIQLASNYIDGHMALALSSLIFLLYWYIKNVGRKIIFENYILLPLLLAYIINLKYTGLFFAGMAVLFLVISVTYLKQWHTLKSLIFTGIITILVTVVVGFQPYITHLLYYDHILFPLKGDNQLDVIAGMTPQGLVPFNALERFGISLFSSADERIDSTFFLKFPFQVSIHELKAFQVSDIRVGGFGPWFGGILLTTCILFLYALLRKKLTKNRTPLTIATFLLCTALFFPASWWARFIGIFWLFPLFLALACDSPWIKKTIITLCLINSFMVLAPYSYFAIKNSYIVDQQYRALKTLVHDEPVWVDFQSLRSNRLRFEKYGISYQLKKNLSCEHPYIIKNHWGIFCLPPHSQSFEDAETAAKFLPYR